MSLYALDNKAPRRDATAFVAPNAAVIGDVTLGKDVSIWFGAVIRGDNDSIVIGDGTNIQENCVLHTDPGFAMRIGEGVTVGHLVMLHGCTIGDGTLVGMHSTILNGAQIGAQCLIGAGSVVTSNKTFPPRSLILGSPAKVVRELSDEEVAGLAESSSGYVERKTRYQTQLRAVDERR
ncbi:MULTISPECIES: gamma carbonic anhydrase family protein [unclassified Modicisalibacter]|uniref:gamma carbonic anhydrase family protein n=1 Tax=unclassified Modicisalibacter TaxID=2679913 RepID=UPI001CCE5D29|nr:MULTISPECIES: gamma carbonic anhydrase family protein [unclassified Modicisalibacter]MBZ9556919.1 gamma carbonic anhydrase family protein [Modicisalibacter sp. R2A 31.J]MBZ9574368.1 gamma carbonic anhydrase family protein [Modicisalibacter sp. MOD 31.J]